jgi:hypothetical protein
MKSMAGTVLGDAPFCALSWPPEDAGQRECRRGPATGSGGGVER